MINIYILILISFVLTIIMYMLLQSIYKLIKLVPSAKPMAKVLSIKKLGQARKGHIDKLLNNIEHKINLITNKITSEEKINELKGVLKRVGLNETVERYYLKVYMYPCFSIVLGFILGTIFRNIPALSYLCKGFSIFLAVMLYFYPKKELLEKLNEKNDKIILEMPRFIRTIRYSPKEKVLSQIVKDYLNSSKSGLRYDLTLLHADFELYTEEEALNKFADRIGIAEVTELVTIIQTTLKGNKENTDINLMFMESKFSEKINTMLDKELRKRPEILDTINDILMYALGLLFLIPMLIHSFKGLKVLMN